MEKILLLATADGLVICSPSGDGWRENGRGLPGKQVTSLIARESVILAGTTDGVYRSDDLGRSWRESSEGLTIRHVRWMAYHPDISDFELVGTEPAGIFISRDGAETWRACLEVAQLRRDYGWSLPYSPEAGCVRGFAIHGQRAYAAVEDGCVLVSGDGGEHWRLAEGSRGHPDHRPAEGFIHSDVHSIAVHPFSPDLVYAPTGGGFYRSQNGGKTWSCLYSGCYCRAVWLDPLDPDHLLLGPADGVDRNGRIEETRDGGRTWQLASDGISVPWPRHMVERFNQVGRLDEGGELLAVLSNGELLSSSLDDLASWRQILPDVGHIAAVTSLLVS